MTYGYVRVSSPDQNLDRQIDALTKLAIKPTNIYADKKSGRDFNRPAWMHLKGLLRQGDLLVVHSLDRFGRNYTEILEEWRDLVRMKGVDIKVLDMPLLDTTNETHGLIGRFVADLVLQVLSFVADNERRNIRERQRQGIAAARARGVKFGRPRLGLPKAFQKCARLVAAGSMSMQKAAEACGMSKSSFWRRFHAWH